MSVTAMRRRYMEDGVATATYAAAAGFNVGVVDAELDVRRALTCTRAACSMSRSPQSPTPL